MTDGPMNIPAGWYPDPASEGHQRTTRTQPTKSSAAPVGTTSTAAAGSAKASRPKKPVWGRWWFISVLLPAWAARLQQHRETDALHRDSNAQQIPVACRVTFPGSLR